MSDNQPFDPTATSIFGLAPVTEDVEEAPVALSARDREAVEALPAGSALLIVQRGPNTGARFLLDPEVTNAGRSPKADIFLDDVTVSRHVREPRARRFDRVARRRRGADRQVSFDLPAVDQAGLTCAQLLHVVTRLLPLRR